MSKTKLKDAARIKSELDSNIVRLEADVKKVQDDIKVIRQTERLLKKKLSGYKQERLKLEADQRDELWHEALKLVVSGTHVRMADGGTKEIQNIVVGDMVVGSDLAGNLSPTKVVNIWDQGIRKDP